MMVRLFSRDAVAKFPCTCGSLPGIYTVQEAEVLPIGSTSALTLFKPIDFSRVMSIMMIVGFEIPLKKQRC